MKLERAKELLEFEGMHVAVLGDVMLDEYLVGSSDRVSPEAPVPVVNLKKQYSRLGGAGNVAANLVALGAKCTLVGVIGDDVSGGKLVEHCNALDGLTSYLIQDDSRITTCKKRIISRNQQLLRVDEEDDKDVDDGLVDKVLKVLKFRHHAEPLDLIILQDYNKGFFSPNMITQVISWCKENGIMTALDPKMKNLELYKGVDVFKPNLSELRHFLERDIRVEPIDLDNAVEETFDRLGCSYICLTMSADGIYISDRIKKVHERSSLRSVVDVSGAGDSVMAILCLLIQQKKSDIQEIAELGNIVGGVACSIAGVAIVTKEQILSCVVKS